MCFCELAARLAGGWHFGGNPPSSTQARAAANGLRAIHVFRIDTPLAARNITPQLRCHACPSGSTFPQSRLRSQTCPSATAAAAATAACPEPRQVQLMRSWHRCAASWQQPPCSACARPSPPESNSTAGNGARGGETVLTCRVWGGMGRASEPHSGVCGQCRGLLPMAAAQGACSIMAAAVAATASAADDGDTASLQEAPMQAASPAKHCHSTSWKPPSSPDSTSCAASQPRPRRIVCSGATAIAPPHQARTAPLAQVPCKPDQPPPCCGGPPCPLTSPFTDASFSSSTSSTWQGLDM